MNKTIFLDIDGCLVEHRGNLTIQIRDTYNPNLLPGVLDKLNAWNEAGHFIVLTTGRKECMREQTENMLLDLGIFWDKLVMGLPRGERVVINDRKPGSTIDMARGISVARNEGLENVVL